MAPSKQGSLPQKLYSLRSQVDSCATGLVSLNEQIREVQERIIQNKIQRTESMFNVLRRDLCNSHNQERLG